MLRVRVSGYRYRLAFENHWRTIPRIISCIRAVNLDQHRIVNRRTESIFHCVHVYAVAVRSELDAILEAIGQVLHELVCDCSITSADAITNAEFGISVQCRPGPNIAPSLSLFVRSDVLRFRANKGPNLIALHALRWHVDYTVMMVFGARSSEINKQFRHRVDRNIGEAAGGPK